jgi:hypothetical protein
VPCSQPREADWYEVGLEGFDGSSGDASFQEPQPLSQREDTSNRVSLHRVRLAAQAERRLLPVAGSAGVAMRDSWRNSFVAARAPTHASVRQDRHVPGSRGELG